VFSVQYLNTRVFGTVFKYRGSVQYLNKGFSVQYLNKLFSAQYLNSRVLGTVFKYGDFRYSI
jgi:hypothetical protein